VADKLSRSELLKQNREQGIDLGDSFYQDGSLLIYSGGKPINFGKGKNKQILQSNGTFPVWNYPNLLLSTSSNYELTDIDNYSTIIFTNSSAAKELKLPLAINNPNRILYIKNKSTGHADFVIKTKGSDRFDDNSTSKTLYLYDNFITLQSNGGSLWYVINSSPYKEKWYTLTITATNVTAWATVRARGCKYLTSDNSWRAKCEICGTHNADADYYLVITGNSVSTLANGNFALAASTKTTTNVNAYYDNSATNGRLYVSSSATIITVAIWGDWPCQVEPTWT
jgi:hypothetical protein